MYVEVGSLDAMAGKLSPNVRADPDALLGAVTAETDSLDWVYVSGTMRRDPVTGVAVLRDAVKVTSTTFHGIPARQVDRRQNFVSDCSEWGGDACSYRTVVWIDGSTVWHAYITYAGTHSDDATIAKLRDFLSGPVFTAMVVRR